MKKSILIGILLLYGHINAAKLTVQTPAEQPICVYVNNINELCVTKGKSKSIEVTTETNHRIFASDQRGNIWSDFLTLQVPQPVNEVTIEAQIKDGKMIVTSLTPMVHLTKEK